MATALLALAGAVLTVILYVALTEQLDYTSVRRRQLDSWALVMSLAWLSGIVYGGVDVRLNAPIYRVPPFLPAPPPQVIPRLTPPALYLDPAGSPVAPPVSPDAVVAAAVVPVAPVAQPVEAVGDHDPAPDHGSKEGDVAAMVSTGSTGSDYAPVAPPMPTATPSSVLVPLPGWPVAPAPQPGPTHAVIALPTLVPRIPATPTPAPPTAVPPTEEPVAPPVPTLQCGEPAHIDMNVRITEAEAEQHDNDLVVRYRVEVTNNSTFPVTMANIEVAALSRGSGSERFGYDTPPNVLLQPGASVPIDGAVRLTKRPSPMSKTDLCITFVGESCGRRLPYSVIRRCSTVSGF